VPAVFGRAHFDSLRSLAPEAGAAALLRDVGARLLQVPMPEAAMDIDTPADLDRLRAHGAREAHA
jgi:molybdenum cofactor cytidylyltransferase